MHGTQHNYITLYIIIIKYILMLSLNKSLIEISALEKARTEAIQVCGVKITVIALGSWEEHIMLE